MLYIIRKLFVILTLYCLAFQSSAFETKVIHANGLFFWTESFGKKEDPALVLIMGSGGQGLLWPEAFCEILASKGFNVIRYDNRDAGLSSAIDYQKLPYTLSDMANDVHFILEGYGIKKSHIVGGSMGGQIAILFAAQYPEETLSLTLCSTSADMRSVFDTFLGKKTNSILSKPSPALVAMAKNLVKPALSVEEQIQVLVDSSKMNNGKAKFNKELIQELARESVLRRQHNPNGLQNHFMATIASYDLILNALQKIKAKTHIIHGDHDLIFGIDHAKALSNAIPQSKLIVLEGLGHALPETFYVPIIENIAAY